MAKLNPMKQVEFASLTLIIFIITHVYKLRWVGVLEITEEGQCFHAVSLALSRHEELDANVYLRSRSLSSPISNIRVDARHRPRCREYTLKRCTSMKTFTHGDCDCPGWPSGTVWHFPCLQVSIERLEEWAIWGGGGTTRAWIGRHLRNT